MYFLNSFSAGPTLSGCRRQLLTSKDCPRAERLTLLRSEIIKKENYIVDVYCCMSSFTRKVILAFVETKKIIVLT